MGRRASTGPRVAVGVALLLAVSALALPAATADWAANWSARSPDTLLQPDGSGPPDYTKLSQIWALGSNGNKPAWASDYHPGGALVALGQAQDGGAEVIVRNATTGALVKELELKDDAYAVRFSPDGTRLAMAGKDRRIVVVNISDWSTEGRLPSIQLTDTINDIAWSDDSRYLFLALGDTGNTGYVWVADSQNGYIPASAMNKQFTNQAVHSIDARGSMYAVGLDDSSSLPDAMIFTIPSGVPLRSSTIASHCARVRFDSTGASLLIGRDSNHGVGSVPQDVEAIVWDTSQNYSGGGNPPHVYFRLHPDTLVARTVAWSPDDQVIASGGYGTNDNLRFWYASNGSEIAHYGMNEIREAKFSADGQTIYIAHGNQGAMWGDTSAPVVVQVTVETPERGGGLFIPRNLKGELGRFVVEFDEDMDTTGAANASFGSVAPFDQFKLGNGSWRSARVWTGEYDIRDRNISDGVNDLTVDGAKDVSGNVMQKWQQFEFMVDRVSPVLQLTGPANYWTRTAQTSEMLELWDIPSGRGQSNLYNRSGWYFHSPSQNQTAAWMPIPETLLAAAQSANGTWTMNLTDGEGRYLICPDASDRAMNRWSKSPTGTPCTSDGVAVGYDSTPPRILRFGSGKQWSSGSVMDLPYDVADGVGLSQLGVNGRFSPDQTNWIDAGKIVTIISGVAANGTIPFPTPQDGYYDFTAVLWDESGLSSNTSSKEANDRVLPDSSLAPLAPLTNDPNLLLDYTASDAASGVAFVDVGYRIAGGQWAHAGSGGGKSGQVKYKATVDGAYEFRSIAEDVAGNRESPPAGNDSWTILDTTPPAINAVKPLPGAVGVATDAVISARLSEAVEISTIVASLTSTSGPVAGSMKLSGLDLTFTPSASMEIAAMHTFIVQAFDRAGNKGTGSWSFKTAIPPDGVPPKVEVTDPKGGTVVSALTRVSVDFDEPMATTTLESPTVTPGQIIGPALSADTKTLSFGITPLTEGTTYTITISSSSARDSSGEPLDGNGDGNGGDDFVFSFQLSSIPGGSILATVLDSNEKPVSGATVHLLAGGTRILTTSSDAKGEARFVALIPGEYGVEALVGAATSGLAKATVLSGQETKLTLYIGGPPARSGLDNILVLLPFIAALSIGVALAAYFRRRSKCPSCRKPVPSRSLRCPACGFYLTPQAAEFFDPGAQVAVAVPGAPPPEVAGARAIHTSPGGRSVSGLEGAGPVIPQRVVGGPQLTGRERLATGTPRLKKRKEVEVDETQDVESDEEETPGKGAAPSKFNPYRPVVMRVGKLASSGEREDDPLAQKTVSQAPAHLPAAAPAPAPAKPNQVEISELDEDVPPPPDDEGEKLEEKEGKEDEFAKARRRRRDRLARGEG